MDGALSDRSIGGSLIDGGSIRISLVRRLVRPELLRRRRGHASG